MPRSPLTLNRLIEELTRFRDQNPEERGELPVKVGYPSHDYWKTELAGDVIGVETRKVKHSAYHGMDQLLDREDDDGEDDPTMPEEKHSRPVVELMIRGNW